MTTYNLYKKRNPLTPFIIINQDTTNTTSTSLTFIGQELLGYGNAEQQNYLWLLENQANSTAPSPAVLGQIYFSTIDNNIYTCTQETGPTVWTKVSSPLVSSTAPTLQLSIGNLWYNTVDGNLYSWNGSSWTAVGAGNSSLSGISVSYYYNVITSGATPTEMWLNGITNNRVTIPPDSTYLFNVTLAARVEELTSENITMSFKGTLDRSDSGSVTLLGGIEQSIYNVTSTLSSTNVTVAANAAQNSILLTVTGVLGKTINWNAVVAFTIVSGA